MGNWLEKLKAGDEVIVCGNWNKFIKTVDKITPTGRIVVDGVQYNQNGTERSTGWHLRVLMQASEKNKKDLQDEVDIKKAISAMKEVRNITAEQARKILEILK